MKPNILFAVADDASHFSAYGHEFLNTPAFDRAAREGILFTGAFTTNPKCAPSRAGILTGRHTWQNRESCLHWNYWPENLEVYTDLLEEAGYHIGYTGKPWGPGNWSRCGRTRNPAGPDYNTNRLVPPEGSRIADIDYAANFRDFLERNPEGKPFHFWYGGKEPHRPYSPGEGRRIGKPPAQEIPVPPYWPDEKKVREDINDYAFEIEWFDRHLDSMLDILEKRGELENTLVVVTSDNGAPFPRIKGQMYEDDFRLPFAVMWKGRIKPGRRVDDLISFTDIAPTFLEAAGVTIPDTMAGRSLFDIFNSDGSGRVTEDRLRVYMGRERHDMGREGDLGYPVRCVRTPEYLYVRNFAPDRWPAGNPETGFTNMDSSPVKSRILELNETGENTFYFEKCFGKRPAEELYDIMRDPRCMENLAEKPEYAQKKEELWSDLKRLLEKTGDPRIFGKGDIFETYEYVNDAPHSWAHYLAGDWKPQKY